MFVPSFQIKATSPLELIATSIFEIADGVLVTIWGIGVQRPSMVRKELNI